MLTAAGMEPLMGVQESALAIETLANLVVDKPELTIPPEGEGSEPHGDNIINESAPQVTAADK